MTEEDRALVDDLRNWAGWDEHGLTDAGNRMLAQAAARIEALSASNRPTADQLQAGYDASAWVLVPKELTEAMARAFEFERCGPADGTCKAIWEPCWNAALAASPKPPEGGGGR